MIDLLGKAEKNKILLIPKPLINGPVPLPLIMSFEKSLAQRLLFHNSVHEGASRLFLAIMDSMHYYYYTECRSTR